MQERTRYLELSGIGNLRRHCMGLLANEQYLSATSFLNDKLPVLLSDIGSWAQGRADESETGSPRAILRMLDRIEVRFEKVGKNVETNACVTRQFADLIPGPLNAGIDERYSKSFLRQGYL